MTQNAITRNYRKAQRLGGSAHHHFFGYYNKTVWDHTGRYILGNRVPFMDRNLTPDLEAEIGFFDSANGHDFVVVGKTTAWNWQMGCQLQWLDGAKDLSLIYNRRSQAPRPDAVYPGFESVIYNVKDGSERVLPLPVYSVSPDSRHALCVNYSRLWITHETIGYVEHDSPKSMENAPSEDGIWCLNLESGQYRLAVSYADLKAFHYVPSMEKAIHWVSHIEINTSSSRCLFLHRWTERVEDETCFLHRLITMNLDGSDMRLLECSDHPLPQLAEGFDPNAVGTYDYEKSEYQISHPLWLSAEDIIVWGPHEGKIHYHLYRDMLPPKVSVIGNGILTENGHMSFSPVDQRWMLSDTYPDSETNERVLFLYDVKTDVRIDLGSFYADPGLKKENRCDLHPRWSRDGMQICIDSVHESERQMYILDVSEICKQDS
ncbi:MAG: hypothetical protein WBF69_12475 [Castellaniella sp.]|uniref:hypothetical protein n=1 Tax=Castellaniella sp. TaxID=1955812 RepID=UPI003C7622D2